MFCVKSLDRTVILHSHSSTLLSLVLEALPRLLYPFRCCHRVKQCLDKGEITALVSSVFWMYKDDAVPEATGSSKRAAADDASVSESYTAGDTKSNFSLHSNSWKEVELEELFLITARTEDYMQACASSFQVDEVDGQENTRNVGDMINAAVSGGAVVVCHLDAKKVGCDACSSGFVTPARRCLSAPRTTQ